MTAGWPENKGKYVLYATGLDSIGSLVDFSFSIMIQSFMHSFLFAVKNADGEADAARTVWWNAVRQLSETAKRNKNVLELAAGCWLIPVDDGLPFLGLCVAEMSQKQPSRSG